jgi:hypothetical protein
MNNVFNPMFINEVINQIKVNSKNLDQKRNKSFKNKIKKLIPSKIYSLLKDKITINKNVDFNHLAMRICIILMVLNTFKKK